jgi:hypothetical protein
VDGLRGWFLPFAAMPPRLEHALFLMAFLPSNKHSKTPSFLPSFSGSGEMGNSPYQKLILVSFTFEKHSNSSKIFPILYIYFY